MSYSFPTCSVDSLGKLTIPAARLIVGDIGLRQSSTLCWQLVVRSNRRLTLHCKAVAMNTVAGKRLQTASPGWPTETSVKENPAFSEGGGGESGKSGNGDDGGEGESGKSGNGDDGGGGDEEPAPSQPPRHNAEGGEDDRLPQEHFLACLIVAAIIVVQSCILWRLTPYLDKTSPLTLTTFLSVMLGHLVLVAGLLGFQLAIPGKGK